jgi:hypothetical protein
VLEHIVPPEPPGTRPAFSAAQVERLIQYGVEVVQPDDLVFADGDVGYDLVLILEGCLKVVERYGAAGEVVISRYEKSRRDFCSRSTRTLGARNAAGRASPRFRRRLRGERHEGERGCVFCAASSDAVERYRSVDRPPPGIRRCIAALSARTVHGHEGRSA